jgi:hypothetical protein
LSTGLNVGHITYDIDEEGIDTRLYIYFPKSEDFIHKNPHTLWCPRRILHVDIIKDVYDENPDIYRYQIETWDLIKNLLNVIENNFEKSNTADDWNGYDRVDKKYFLKIKNILLGNIL